MNNSDNLEILKGVAKGKENPMSYSYGDKEKGQTDNFTDLSNLAPEAGLEPATL